MLSAVEVLVSLLSALTWDIVSLNSGLIAHGYRETHNALAVAGKTLLPLALAFFLVLQLLLLELLGLVCAALGVWSRC